jgi:Flp pilus assembly protein TadD
MYQSDSNLREPQANAPRSGQLTRSELGWVLLMLGDQAGAEAEMTQAVTLARNTEMPPQDQAPILVNLASLRIRQGKLSEAATLLEQASSDVTAVIELARLHRLQGTTARAAPLLRRAEAMINKLHGPGHPELAQVWAEQALLELGRSIRL